MKRLLNLCLLSILGVNLNAQELSESDIIDRARATIGTEAALDALVTLDLVGRLEPVDRNMPAATLLIVLRKPLSQRLEIKVDDIVETTILDGNRGCIIRSKLKATVSRMRDLTEPELKRVVYSTRQFFNFYRPDFKNGEKVSLVGTETHREVRSYKLLYEYPEGLQTYRYFSVADEALVSTIGENGLESVGVGSQIVAGIKFPERIDYYEGDRKLHTIVLDAVKVNKPLTTGIFSIPQGDTQ
jgi:hypothetical protein